VDQLDVKDFRDKKGKIMKTINIIDSSKSNQNQKDVRVKYFNSGGAQQ